MLDCEIYGGSSRVNKLNQTRSYFDLVVPRWFKLQRSNPFNTCGSKRFRELRSDLAHSHQPRVGFYVDAC